MKPFFNNPLIFSFKDALALCMCGPFIVAIILYLMSHVPEDLELIKTLIPIIVVVLGGYFGQEVATSYFTRGQIISPYGSYGGYSSYGTTTATTTATTTTGEQGPP